MKDHPTTKEQDTLA